MKRRWKVLLVVLAVLGAAVFAGTPRPLDYAPAFDESPDLDSLVSDLDSGLVPGTEKRLSWYGAETATEWSVVALHGFSASRQETAPLAELVAARLGANLFETRFSGHGLQRGGLVDVRAEQWLDDVAEALAVGRLIGDKVVVIAVSNGAALALSMLDHRGMQDVDALIMISPNFAPADPKARWITRPGGALLLRLLAGGTRSWEPHNPRQAMFWTTRYPSRTLVEVMRVVDRAEKKIASVDAPRLQVFYSPDDKVISVPALLADYDALRSPQKEIRTVAETGTEFAHMIVGDIISPDNTRPVAEEISRFVLRRAR